MFSGYLPIFRRGTQLERSESSVNRQMISQNRPIHPRRRPNGVVCLSSGVWLEPSDSLNVSAGNLRIFFGQFTDSLLAGPNLPMDAH